jgi:hypothetical protein
LLHAADQEVMPGTDDKWRHFRSANFELYSRNSEGPSRELLHNLELLRGVFMEDFKLVERRRLDVTVIFFREEKDFHAYLPASFGKGTNFSGLYVGSTDRSYVLVAPVDDWASAQQLIYHEFVHHLFMVTEDEPPVWLNEGMADLLSTIEVGSDGVQIGKPSAGRLMQIHTEKLMPLEQLFAVDQNSRVFQKGEHTGLFYAESWALVHYLYFGKSGLSKDGIDRFLNFVRRKPPPTADELRAAFRGAFSMDYPEMLKRLEHYVTSGRYSWGRRPMPKIEPADSYAMRAVPRDEIRVRLAGVALCVNQNPYGKLLLLEAVKNRPADPRPLEELGSDALRDGDELTAKERWGKALEIGSRNPAIYRELALMECGGWFSQFDLDFRLPEETARHLRTLLQGSIKYAPEQTVAYEMLAWIEAYAAEPSIPNINLVQTHFSALKEKQRTLLALAVVRFRANDKTIALHLLDSLDTMRPDAWVARGMEIVRAKIEGRPVKRLPRTTPSSSHGEFAP